MREEVKPEQRPHPPAELLADDLFYITLAPAPDLSAWMQDQILAEDGAIHGT